jgi:hypothetical protein
MPFEGPIPQDLLPTSWWSRWIDRFSKKQLVALEIPQIELASATPSEILTLGRALIEDRHSWVQRRYETIGDKRCAAGALMAVARKFPNVYAPLGRQVQNGRLDTF